MIVVFGKLSVTEGAICGHARGVCFVGMELRSRSYSRRSFAHGVQF